MNNLELRHLMKKKKIPMWKIADYLGVHENTVSRMFRHELSEAKTNQIKTIIKELSK